MGISMYFLPPNLEPFDSNDSGRLEPAEITEEFTNLLLKEAQTNPMVVRNAFSYANFEADDKLESLLRGRYPVPDFNHPLMEGEYVVDGIIYEAVEMIMTAAFAIVRNKPSHAAKKSAAISFPGKTLPGIFLRAIEIYLISQGVSIQKAKEVSDNLGNARIIADIDSIPDRGQAVGVISHERAHLTFRDNSQALKPVIEAVQREALKRGNSSEPWKRIFDKAQDLVNGDEYEAFSDLEADGHLLVYAAGWEASSSFFDTKSLEDGLRSAGYPAEADIYRRWLTTIPMGDIDHQEPMCWREKYLGAIAEPSRAESQLREFGQNKETGCLSLGHNDSAINQNNSLFIDLARLTLLSPHVPEKFRQAIADYLAFSYNGENVFARIKEECARTGSKDVQRVMSRAWEKRDLKRPN